MSVRVRFAPSPTGKLHLGNARIAMMNFLFSAHGQGEFLLRIDDTDRERSREEFVVAIKDDLRWLGVEWDEEARQSQRLERYAGVLESLQATGHVYACYETAEELDFKRKRQLASGKPPIYDRAALKLTDAERAKYVAEGRKPHWRFKLAPGEVAWDDMVRGPCRYEAEHLSDPVLMRADGVPLYTLTSVIDDIEFGITHVIRGEDHVTNTVPQIQLFRALHDTLPAFAHLPLMVDAQGKGLSKRMGSLTLESLRDQGIERMAVNDLLARGGAAPAEPAQVLDPLVMDFDLHALGRASPRFDPVELEHINARLLHHMPFELAKLRLLQLDIDADRAFWLAVRGNLKRFADASDWWAICRTAVTPAIAEQAYVKQAREVLPPEPWGETTWRDWTQAVAAATGRKGRLLFHPLRLALTGRGDGPELAALLPLIGRDRALARLEGKAA